MTLRWTHYLAFLIWGCPIQAQDAPLLNGAMLQRMCNAELGASGETMCLFYIAGFSEGLEFGSMMTVAEIEGYPGYDTTLSRAQTLLNICIPSESNIDQIRLVIQKFLADHPERLHESAKFLVPAALAAAFPCRAP